MFLLLLLFLLLLFKSEPGGSSNADYMIVLVTGSSSDIGKSIAILFAEDSRFKVYATMRDISKWTGPTLPNLALLPMDVTYDESVTSAIETIERIEGGKAVDIGATLSSIN